MEGVATRTMERGADLAGSVARCGRTTTGGGRNGSSCSATIRGDRRTQLEDGRRGVAMKSRCRSIGRKSLQWLALLAVGYTVWPGAPQLCP